MLERLRVEALGIIDEVVLEPGDGFIALTGETGAGKSLLGESLKLLAGARGSADMVRSGAERLRVEGHFSFAGDRRVAGVLEELGIPGEEPLVIRREVSASGRSRCFVNDTGVSAAALQRLALELLAILGQHEQHGLAEGRVQRQLVDEFGGHGSLVASVAEAHARWVAAAGAVDQLERARERRRDRLDAISFQVAEIDAVAPRAAEDVELAERRQVLRHAVRLLEVGGSLLGRLAEGESAVSDQLARAGRELKEMAACGLRLSEGAARLDEARVLVEEVVREVQSVMADVDQDPAELDNVESRLFGLEQLMLKYGSPVEKVIEHRDRLLGERLELEAVEDRLAHAAAAAHAALAAFDLAAGELERSRRRAGDELLAEVARILGDLRMGGTRLELRWQPKPDPDSPLVRDGRGVTFGPDGVEECELLIAANPGEELRPMARIASGGELSRIHLALRTALRGRHPSASLTLLFDEVDSGLGGGTAAALAGLLASLAATDQVLVVTHLPQVAARAASHFRVEKVVEAGRAVTRVARLDGDGRELELARMLGGEEPSGTARDHARDLLGWR